MEENALPTLIFMLRSEDTGIHYEAVCESCELDRMADIVCFCYADVVSNGYLLFLFPFIVTVTGTVGIPCFICSDNPN